MKNTGTLPPDAPAPSNAPAPSRAVIEAERASLTRHGRLNTLHWVVLGLSLLATLAAWQYAKSLVALRTQARFEVAADHIPGLMRERLQKYELALLAGVSTIKANGGDIDWPGWKNFASNLHIEKLYPGINGISVIHEVLPEDLGAYLEKQRLLRPDFHIHPDHDKDVYRPISYIYPVDINAAAVGLDMAHEANRYDTFNNARDTGSPQITGPIVLVQDAARTPGFVFFSPIYSGKPEQTPQARRAAFKGMVSAPFIVSKLMEGTLGKDRRSTQIRITDGAEIIYDEITPETENFDAKPLGEKRISIQLYGRTWDIDIRAGQEFRAENSPHQSTYILIAGIVVDLVLFILFTIQVKANRRGLRFADMATLALQNEAKALEATNAELVVARENAESIGEMKAAFLSTMSHEIRTPLNAIGGILTLLERAKLPEEEEMLVQAGKVASEKLLTLLTNILDISKLEANAVQLWEREITLRPLIEEWAGLAAGMIEQTGKQIAVNTQIADDLPEKAIVDDIRLAQIVNNLMDNAVRFTDEGLITITALKGGPIGTSPASFVLAITDTGKGISAEDLPVIFDRFRQVDGSITRTKGGSGLGLSICRDLAQLLGGTLVVASDAEGGTVFTLVLPTDGTGNVPPKHKI